MKKMILLFCCVICSGIVTTASNVVSLPDLVNPAALTMDGKQLYITEGISLLTYSLPNFKLIKKFGKRGEAPEEFLPPFDGLVRVHINPNNLMIISGYKLSYFSKNGEFIKMFKIPTAVLTNRYIRPLPGGFVGSALKPGTPKEQNMVMIAYNIYDRNFKVVKEIYRARQGFQGPNSKVKFNPLYWTLKGPELYVADKKIFIGHYGQDEKGVIHVFDSKGKKMKDIEPPYENIAFTPEGKKHFKDEFATPQGKQFYESIKHLFDFSPNLPNLQSFQVLDNKIFIQTYKRDKTGATEFIVLDLAGKLIKKVMVPIKYQTYFSPYPYVLSSDKLYQTVENDDEESWSIHVFEIK